jgi:hypothetical protein
MLDAVSFVWTTGAGRISAAKLIISLVSNKCQLKMLGQAPYNAIRNDVAFFGCENLTLTVSTAVELMFYADASYSRQPG